MRTLKVLVFAAALGPLAVLAWGAVSGGLGANPIETVTRETGTWTLRFLLITLAITPLRRAAGWNAAIRFRRMLGLFAFFYGALHLLTYLWLDQFFDVPAILKDVYTRPFITAGLSAFLSMVPLAATSTAGMIRWMGGTAWRRLHRLAYLAAVAGVVHYWWLVKLDVTGPQIYAAVLASLLGVRAAWVVASKRARMRQARALSTLQREALDRRPPPAVS
ncbi:MAG: protein-methionine-sulfoxide reductase heme-binding subunit MsrQ [Acidobacteriota bacterium]